jgi:hypothetical protein
MSLGFQSSLSEYTQWLRPHAAADAVPSLRSERVIGKPLARHTLREFFSPLL